MRVETVCLRFENMDSETDEMPASTRARRICLQGVNVLCSIKGPSNRAKLGFIPFSQASSLAQKPSTICLQMKPLCAAAGQKHYVAKNIKINSRAKFATMPHPARPTRPHATAQMMVEQQQGEVCFLESSPPSKVQSTAPATIAVAAAASELNGLRVSLLASLHPKLFHLGRTTRAKRVIETAAKQYKTGDRVSLSTRVEHRGCTVSHDRHHGRTHHVRRSRSLCRVHRQKTMDGGAGFHYFHSQSASGGVRCMLYGLEQIRNALPVSNCGALFQPTVDLLVVFSGLATRAIEALSAEMFSGEKSEAKTIIQSNDRGDRKRNPLSCIPRGSIPTGSSFE